MIIPGRLQVRLRAGVAPGLPAHVDVVIGACCHAPRIDGGPLDRALRRWGGAFRATSVYPARRSLLRAGTQHLGYDEREHALGLSRTLRVELAERGGQRNAVEALRDLAAVEVVRPETLAFTQASARMGRPVDAARAMVRADEALALEPGDERITVAIVDTGVALGHPELRRKLLAGYDTVDIASGSVGGLDLVGDLRGLDFTPRDDVGHGSHIAGVLAAQGFRVPRGLAGRSLALPIRVLAAALSRSSHRRVGVGVLSDIDCGIKVACDLGADVLNMSFGTPESLVDAGAPPPHAEVVRYAAAGGRVLVAAAGNNGREERFFPAALPEVIAVGAVDDAGLPSSFSTRGAHVALAAPGERVASIGLRGHKRATGTSHAAPFVAAAAALLLARARRRGVVIDGAAVRRLLMSSAQRVDADPMAVGAGILDAEAALRAFDAEVLRCA